MFKGIWDDNSFKVDRFVIGTAENLRLREIVKTVSLLDGISTISEAEIYRLSYFLCKILRIFNSIYLPYIHRRYDC